MREKYIRFFISSTFEDMILERNLLQSIFDELSENYAQKGWQIESIDLRWGITKEAGMDNKTMQICMTELKRCQELSPKPNFIILMGDRYGWIPLPEIINQKDIAPNSFSEKEQKLFYDWYELDENYLEPNYVLKPRYGEFEDDKYWKEWVENPLSELFKRHHLASYGLSATEQEIQAGALEVSDASDHVIAYMRHIKHTTIESTNTQESETEEKRLKQEALWSKVKAKLGDNNILLIDNLTSDEYGKDSFCCFFIEKMRQRIVDIVDKIIKEFESGMDTSDMLTQEIGRHISIAERETTEFIGRKDVLDYISEYLNDLHSNQALWIKAPSGVGKSTLLAKLAVTYQYSHHVICRFCGQTSYSLMTNDLLGSIWAELKRHDMSHTDNSPVLPYFSLVAGKLHYFQSDRPLLLIIDAINLLHDEEYVMASMKWLPEKGLSKNVKVIFSSTDELRYKISRPYVREYILQNMGEDALDMISNNLYRNGRRLCESQLSAVKQLLEQSECSAIYLKVLSQYLSKLASTSRQSIEKIPKDLTGLVKLVISNILESGHHNLQFVEKILSLLSQERIGLTPSEILDMVAADEMLYKSIADDSFHHIESHKIPIVIWSRLYYELSTFIRYSYTIVGQVLTIYHAALKAEFVKAFLPSHKEKAETAYALYDFFAQKDLMRDIHANKEMMYQGYIAACHYSYIDVPRLNDIKQRLFDQLTDVHCIIQKNLLFPKQFREEIDMFSSIFSQETQNMLKRVKYEITEVSKHCSCEREYEYYIKMLPSSFYLRKLVDKSLSIPVMDNGLADIGCYPNVEHVVNNIGDCLVMREDGEMVAYLTENCHCVNLCKLPTNEIVSYTLSEEITAIDFDDLFQYNIIQTKNKLIVYDTFEKKALLCFNMGDIKWYSLCKKRSILAIGKESEFYIYNFEGDVESWLVPTVSGMFSPTGNYIWLIHKDSTIHRFDMDCEILSFGKIQLDNPESYCIRSCSEEWMSCCGGVIVYHYKEEKHNHYCRFNYQLVDDIYLGEDNNTVVTIIDGLCKIYKLNRHGENFELQLYRETHIEDVLAVSRSLDYALIKTHNIAYVCNFKKEMARFSPLAGGNTGINNLACNSQGNEIVLSVGVNHGGRPGDENQATLRITDNILYEWMPPFDDMNYNYVSATAISPNGCLTAAASVNKNCEILLYDNKKKRQINNNYTKDKFCVAMDFSQDGKYLIAHSGDYFATLPPTLYLMSDDGKLLLTTELNGDYWSSKNHIRISIDNKYVFSAGEFKEVGIYSLLQKRQLFIGTDFKFYACRPYEGLCVKELGFVVYIPHCHSVLANDSSGRVCILDLDQETYTETHIYGNPLAVSASGKHIYFLENEMLTMHNWPLYDDGTILMDNVRWVIPALDDNHIFITLNNFTILLYNIELRCVEQNAYFGMAIFQKICSSGLVTAFEGEGKIALFKPDLKYKVNDPAITYFVRRWNFETNQLESATAICPLCGNEIVLTSDMKQEFGGRLANNKDFKWYDSKLLKIKCPHCAVEILYNPYIV